MATDLLTELTANGGFTYDQHTDRLLTTGSTTGYAIAIPGTERHLPATLDREGFATAFAGLMADPALTDDLAKGAVVGGWYSADRDVYMVELVYVWDVPRPVAVKLGRHYNQEAIYDLRTGEEITTGGTGDTATPTP